MGNETRMFTASKDTSVKVCDAASGEELHAMEGHSYDVNTLLLVGNTLFSGADAKGATREYLKAWNAETGAVHTRSLDGHGGGVWALAADTDSKLLFSGGDDRTIRVWNLETYECLHTSRGTRRKYVVCTMRRAASTQEGTIVKCWYGTQQRGK